MFLKIICINPQAYKLISRPKGLALILSNVNFSSETDLEFRSGGDVDCVALDTLFGQLGYQVILRHDRTAQVSLKSRTSVMCLPRSYFLQLVACNKERTGIVSNMKNGYAG